MHKFPPGCICSTRAASLFSSGSEVVEKEGYKVVDEVVIGIMVVDPESRVTPTLV